MIAYQNDYIDTPTKVYNFTVGNTHNYFAGGLGAWVHNAGIDCDLRTFGGASTYIKEHGELPSNFITKAEARELGWNPRDGNLADVAPGKSIGGDVFRNREGLLPEADGRVWREADINYSSGRRGGERILYSNDGLIYKTTDHYATFTLIE